MTFNLKSFTAISNPNIAFIKYWGKSDEELNLPTNESISLTLDKLITSTTIEEALEDEFILDQKREKVPQKMKKILEIFKRKVFYQGGLKIISENNFPKACGLASSASGYSALVKALDGFFNCEMTSSELSVIARLGSGSASRSLFNGLVLLKQINEKSFESQLIGVWDELKVLVVVVTEEEKKVSSTQGMINTVKTSSLFPMRLINLKERIPLMLKSLKERNFEDTAIIAMKDSNEIHACCLSSFPPLCYLSDESFKIIEAVNFINQQGIKVFYTFDAGKNCFLITHKKYYKEIKEDFERNYKIVEAL